jgi:hypothetical protein
MYCGVKQFIKEASRKTDSELKSIFQGSEGYKELSARILGSFKAKRNLEKHMNKKAHTERWYNKTLELQEKVTTEVSQLMIFFNMAHSFQVSFFKLIYRVEHMRKTGDIIPIKEVPINYMELLDTLSFLDSTDRERYILFNRLRNIFFHSTLNRLISLIDKEFADDFVDLIEDASVTNNIIFTPMKKEAKIIIECDFEDLKTEIKPSKS